MPDPNFRLTFALVYRKRFLLFLRRMVLHYLIAFLLLEDTALLLHLLGFVFVPKQIFTGNQRVLQLLLDVNCIALFVGSFGQ